uniref:Uncharacterized protein n=1 Tax=Amphimedon queenslandica TaxID=400682 RepID=A0A1X7TH11_AMPQE
EPTKEQIQQDPDKEQQQLLQEKARLTQQLVDATTLLEQAEKDKSSLELEYYKKLEAQIADNKVYVTEILEKKQIITEDYEKLKLKVAEQLEEKEEQYLKEKQIIIDENQNLISEKDKVIAKLTSQVEEQLQIFADLKEKELYIAKLVKERQERVLKQPIKETSSIGLQFNYLIPSMDSLDSSVIIAGQKLFILQGDRSHSLQWEKYGFRLECPQGAVSKDTEVAVTALAGGNFKVPKGTMLVSAVYAISVSKGLLKPLVIELQHCVDLRKTSQTGCLKFVRAPLKSPNAYQFSIVEGGSFSVGNRYGSIERDEFCAFGIVHVGNGDTPNGGRNGSENDTQTQGTNNDWEKETNGDTPNDSSNGAGENSGGGGATPSTKHFRDTLYSGMMYYDKKETGHWKAMYSVVRDLEVLKTYLENKQTSVEYDNIADLFKFIQPNGTLKMTLQTTQLQLGWTVYPDRKPMELFQSTIDYFPLNPLYSSCSMSVYAKPGIAQDPLHCPIELTGIDPLKVVYINKSPPALPPSMSPTTSSSSSNVVHESASVSSTGGASPSATSDVTKVKKVIGDVLVSHYAALNSLKTSLSDLASQLYAAHLISDEVKETRSMENFITEFKASLNFKRKLPQVEEHCQKFLSSFIAVRGSYADAAIVLCEDWIEVIRNELGINFSINIDA